MEGAAAGHMIDLLVLGLSTLLVAVAMTMVGKGGGNFYVLILALGNTPMHEAAATGQFMLLSASVSAALIFGRKGSICWPLALVVGTSAALAALGGGYFSHCFSGFSLKLIFSALLLISGAAMLAPRPVGRSTARGPGSGIVDSGSGDETYSVNLWMALPATALAGFASGMVGVSGGSFLVPLMVLACGLPMHVAVGTASVLVAATAFMGFAGHAVQGDFNPSSAIPLALVAVAGGLLGGRLSLKARPRHLGRLFAYTNWLAALAMILNAFHARGLG